MKKVYILQDFLCHTLENDKLIKRSAWTRTFFSVLKSVLGENTILKADYGDSIINENGEKFNRTKFFELCGLKDIPEMYYPYKSSDFTKEAIEYLSSFFNENCIIIGYELGKQLCDTLTSFGCKIIDIALHPFRIYDDFLLLFHTNDSEIHRILKKYQFPEEQFYFYANYWKEFMLGNNMVKDDDIEQNSALFVGQTLKDKSVDYNGKYLNVTDYKDKIHEITKQYSKLYYSPHPLLGSRWKKIYNFIKNTPNVELLQGHSTYSLLASDKIKKVVALSTSVLFEAQYFGKEIEYWYRPLYNIDAPYEEYSYISIGPNMFFNQAFWKEILSPICNTKEIVLDQCLFNSIKNRLRNIDDNYFGYAALDDLKRFSRPNFSKQVRQIFNFYIGRYRS